MIIERKLIVNNDHGLHARPASDLVKLAKNFKSETFLFKANDKNKKANCKSVLSILLLGAIKGTELILQGNGSDANEAINEISNFFNRNFNEVS